MQSCAYFECDNTINGQVIGTDNLPLSNITISPRLAPNVTIGVSSVGGYFSLNGICYGQDYVFRGDGYLDIDINFSDVEANVTMERFGESLQHMILKCVTFTDILSYYSFDMLIYYHT